MKRNILKKIGTVLTFTVSIILSWGGILYAINDPAQFRGSGILVSFSGYALFFRAVLRYDNISEDQR